jgi:quinoprotein glucose dehydrogenase
LHLGASNRIVTGCGAAVLAAVLGLGIASEWAAGQESPAPGAQQDRGWPAYNGGVNGDHYSPLTQMNRTNVRQLKMAWQFDTGEKGNLQTNPLVEGRVLYACTFSGKVIALDAATGHLLWTFDSSVENRDKTIGGASQPSRGLAYWTDGKSERIFAGVMNYLYALDGKTGKPIAEFGDQGRIDLRKGLREDLDAKYEQQSIALTTPGVVYKDLIIVGGRNPETHPAPPGYVRAFDVRTGALRWTFHTIPQPGEVGYDTWPPEAWKDAGAANNWSGMTLDRERGIVYVPTGSICLRIRCWRSMRTQASGCGISRACITTSGTGIFLRRRRW